MKKIVLLSILAVALTCCKQEQKQEKKGFDSAFAKAKIETAWNETYPAILKKIVPPMFKADTVVVDDQTDFRDVLNASIIALSRSGGGVVHVPAGTYDVKGPILFESNINLNLAEGAILVFSNEPNDYLPPVKARWEGTFAMNYSPLIYAVGKENLAITGKGEIDGNCEDTWGQWKPLQKSDKKIIRQMGNDQILIEERVFGDGHFLRPTGIEFIECKNILLEDFTIHHTPFWTIHPVICENITARRLNIQMGVRNDDGFDPEHCKNVLLENSVINTWDDCVSIKAGRDQDGWDYPPSENIIVRNNDFTNVVGSGFCIGSEMAGGVRNVFVHDNSLNGSDKHAFQFKSNPDRGGFIKEVYMKNMKVTDSVAYAFEFTTDYKGWRGNEHYVQYNDFYFQNIDVRYATDISIKINGTAVKPIQRVFMENITIQNSDGPVILNHTEDVILENVTVGGKLYSAEHTITTVKTNKQ